MRIAALFCSLILLLTPSLSLGEGGMTILTVSGATVSPNRPANTPEDPGFFTHHNIEFEKAYAFDRADLQSLPAYTIEATLPGTDRKVSYSGPRLVDVLKLAQAQGEQLYALALDGYAAVIEYRYLVDNGAILAIDIDGKPMGVGELGPAMIVFEPVEDASLAEELSDMQAWAVFYISVQ